MHVKFKVMSLNVLKFKNLNLKSLYQLLFMRSTWLNRPFPSSKKSHFQSEAKCEAIDMKMIFNYDANKTHFHNKGFALSLVLRVRFFGTRKWPIILALRASERMRPQHTYRQKSGHLPDAGTLLKEIIIILIL